MSQDGASILPLDVRGLRYEVNGIRLIKDISFTGEYRGAQIAEDKKSVTIHYLLGSDDHTLASEEIDEAAQALKTRVTDQLGAEIPS